MTSTGAPVRDVILPDGMSLNQELVKQSWCWWCRKYAPRDTALEGLEKEAREGRKGLWGDPQPVHPLRVAEGVKTGQRMRTANPISGSKGSAIAVVVGCAMAVATTALLPSTELSITDSCQIDGPIQTLKSALQGQRYWVKQL